MKNILKKCLCCFLSMILVLSTGLTVFAADDEPTPVIIVNDIFYNPIYNTEDGSVAFSFSDYQIDLLFTTGFSENFLSIFSEDMLESVNEMNTLDIIMILLDFVGFSGDINKIINSAIETIIPLMSSIDTESVDLTSILQNIDFNQYIADLKSQITAPVDNFKKIGLDDNGSLINEQYGNIALTESLEYYYDEDVEYIYSHTGTFADAIADTVGYDNTYIFTYDWRVDPTINAEALSEFVDLVKEQTGSDKVSIISEGYGSTIATTYLAIDNNASDNVENFVTLSSEFLGTSLMGDFMKGDIVNKFTTNITNFTSAYIRYTNDVSNNPITAFITWLINYVLNTEWEIQSLCLDIEKIISDMNYYVEYKGITAEITKMPGLWALVPAYDFDSAIENLGIDTESELYSVISEFKNYQYNYEDILLDAKENGINISVVASWDLQILPIGENNSVQSDGIVDTAYASFGASCIDLNEVSKASKADQAYPDGHDHLSANYDMLTPWYDGGAICYYIDASTCALPENTWFIKNMKHGTFSYDSNSREFLLWLLTSEKERTVWQDVAYKQFMNYNRYINPGILSSDGIKAETSEPGAYLLGDINLDTLVTSLDARIALRAETGAEYIEEGSIPFKNGDVYADTIINSADARKILLMSAGLIDYMQSGIKFDYNKEQGSLPATNHKLALTTSYNAAENILDINLILLDAAGATSGNFVINYDSSKLKYVDTDSATLNDGFVVSGAPIKTESTLTCAFAVSNKITAEDCDENGNLLLATYKFEVARYISDNVAVSAGASHFYNKNTEVFINPVAIKIPASYFVMLGDADNNRYISAGDARTTLRIAAKLEKVTDELMFKRCDVDGDGKITSKDARLILRVSAKLEKTFPASTK